ncbi:unnamed protein product [Miscanthus lutarioriparius]|uniref:RRM domain-containing protein n=1 Tax=Miscanthus lutarioriparius TaxID=422564 RepID=A0A811NCG8_9POAL|nr:unnamed protein product [Miscanthus lutarioriparius]
MLTSVKLAELLSADFPDLAGDTTILRKLLVVEALPDDCSSHDLMAEYSSFGILLRAEIVRDDIGHRAGLLVFESVSGCSAATAEPFHGAMIATPAPFLDMRNHRRSYLHLRSLIAVLDTVFPAATQDPNFLNRSLLMEGVSLRATPRDLLDEALGVQVEAAVVVRDAEFGDSVGLLVLTHAHDTEVATAAGPRPGVFCDCIKASDSSYTRFQILEALDDRVRRQATAELSQSLDPQSTFLADADMTFHLSCVFLRGPGCSSEGAVYNLCNIGAEVLLAIGPVNAVFLGPDHDVAVLCLLRRPGYGENRQKGTIFAPEAAGDVRLVAISTPWRRSCRGGFNGAASAAALRHGRRLPGAGDSTDGDYLGPVILQTEIDTTTCDAADIARFITSPAEAVSIGVATTGIPGRMVRSFRESGGSSTPGALEATPRQQQQQLAPVQQLDLSRLSLGMRQWLNPAAFETVRLEFSMALAGCPDHNFMELNLGLIGLAALSEPHALRRSYFPDRAVLLTRTRIE